MRCNCGSFCPKGQTICLKCKKAKVGQENGRYARKIGNGVFAHSLGGKEDKKGEPVLCNTENDDQTCGTGRSSKSTAISDATSLMSGSFGQDDNVYPMAGVDGRNEDVLNSSVNDHIPSLVCFDVVKGTDLYCRNCHRCECHDGFDGLQEYRCILSLIGLDRLRRGTRKWNIFTEEDCDGYDEIVLCLECIEVLSIEEYEARGKKPSKWISQWPAYCWRLLSSPEVQDTYGQGVLRFLPKQWWGYWTSELNRLFPSVFKSSDPSYYANEGLVVDVTQKRGVMFDCRRELKLGRIKKVYDALLMPLVLCPWGCACYFHDNGNISFDSVMLQYLGYVGLCGTIGGSTKGRIESARLDYFNKNVSLHLFNPDWRVVPSVYFKADVGPVFMTCHDHDGGTMEQYFHVPKNSIGLPSRNAECLSSAVLRTRTLKPSMPRKYSNGYRLQKCLASYCGIDTAVVSEDRYFDYASHVEDLSEIKSYAYRSDIRGTTRDLAAREEITSEYMSELEKRKETLFRKEVLNEENQGTMMCLKDAVRLQKWLGKSSVETALSSEDEGMIVFRPNWPSVLIYIHANNCFGARIPFPNMMRTTVKSGSVCMLSMWVLCCITVGAPEIWEDLHECIDRADVWCGFLLSYLARKVTRHSVAVDKKRNPFYVVEGHNLMSPKGLDSKIFEDKSVEFPRDICTVLESSLVTSGKGVHVEHVTRADWTGIRLSSAEAYKYVLVIVNCQLETLPDYIMSNGSKFELRTAVFHESMFNPRTLNTWEAECWRRHGGVFRSWWVCQRSSTNCRERKEISLDGCNLSRLRLMVFVLCDVESTTSEFYQKEYLRYIGGQATWFCYNHRVPLITAATVRKGQSKLCSEAGFEKNGQCRQVGVYECPMEKCRVCICKDCFGNVKEEGAVCYAKDVTNVTSFDSVYCQPIRGTDVAFLADQQNNETCCSTSRDEVALNLFDDVQTNEQDDPGSVAGDNESIEDTFDMLHTGCDAPMFDIQHQEGDGEDNVLDEGQCVIQSSIHGAKEDKYEGRLSSMGTSVLLNKFGTILVRRDNRLQASRREQNLTERVVSRRSTGSVPLVWLEGMLFPSIFWSHPYDCHGGLLGAIPTALLCQHKTRARFRIASLASHAKLRLKSAASTASLNPCYLSFLFDSLANGALEGNDTRVVLSRGFEETMGPAGMRMRNGEDDFYTDTIDNRQNCHNLCASEREKRSTLFVTLTCNQKQHFGVRSVKRYVDSDACLENYRKCLEAQTHEKIFLSAAVKSEVRCALQEAARNLIVRNWMEVRIMLIRYILKSPEEPLGDIEKIFVRDEYQTESGNLSHLHMLLTLKNGYETTDGKDVVEKLIRGFVDEIVGFDEVPEYINEGLLDDWKDYAQMKDDARRLLKHSCDSHRCLRRTGPGENDVKCRVPDTRLLSKDLMSFSEVKYDIAHDQDALKLYEKMRLCETQEENGGKFISEVDFLNPKRILPPARFGEGIITPVVGRLFAATRSSMNIQICTGFGTSRYLVKYITKIDENNYVVFSVNQTNPSKYKVEVVNLHNTKISSSAINEKKRMSESRHRSKPKGRAIASTEMMQIILGYPQVYTNVAYIKVPTLPLGDRPGLERKTPREKWKEESKRAEKEGGVIPDLFEFCVPQIGYRQEYLSTERQFTIKQQISLEDQVDSPVTIDRVTIFGARPPELLCVDKMEWYFRYFARVDLPELGSNETRRQQFKDNVAGALQCSWWVDGFGERIMLRVQGISELQEVIETKLKNKVDAPKIYSKTVAILKKICYYYSKSGISTDESHVNSGLTRGQYIEWVNLQATFIDTEHREEKLPIPVFSNVRPRNATKFIVHLLLSMGRFETEADLWGCFDTREAFIAAGMVDKECVDDLDEEDCLSILKRWIMDQCQYYPISSKALDNYVCSAASILKGVLLRNEIPVDELPPCLYTQLFKSRTEDIVRYREDIRSRLIRATLNGLEGAYGDSKNNLPQFDRVLQGSSKGFGAELQFGKSPAQSSSSYQEQQHVFHTCAQTIKRYKKPATVACKGTIIVGPPGAGKTHCLLQAVLYSLCEGLTCITTAILAERALLLGGMHFHQLFKLKVRDSGYKVHRLAELAVVSLQKNPDSMAFLRSLDVLFVDEMGQLSAELLSVLDIILRRIRDSSLFMGGVLVIGTLDQLQLRPIKELPFLISPYIMTCFQMVRLKHYVRCADCMALQEMNELARFYSTEEEARETKLKRFEELVSDNCTFVETWKDGLLEEGVLRIFPKKRQAIEATTAFLNAKREDVLKTGGDYLSSRARDTMVPLESHGEWKAASRQVIGTLNKEVLEPERLDFYVGAVYQFTYNQKQRFSTTQLAVLLKLPTREDLENYLPVEVWAAPPGTKIIDIEGKSCDELKDMGWTTVEVGPAPEFTRTIWSQGVKGKRKQYGLKHHIASTVHSAIGHTMYKVATELSLHNGVWERAMVVVLISRVKRACDIIFVGDKKQNLDALVEGLRIRCQYDDYMNHLVDVLCGLTERIGSTGGPRIQLSNNPFRPRDIPLPMDSSGVVYLLVSIQNGCSLYVGYTQNLARRLKQHNSGYGSSSTSDPLLRPWALAAYVCGFEGNRSVMRCFESAWQQQNAFYRPKRVGQSIGFASELCQNEKFVEWNLVVVDQVTDLSSSSTQESLETVANKH